MWLAEFLAALIHKFGTTSFPFHYAAVLGPTPCRYILDVFANLPPLIFRNTSTAMQVRPRGLAAACRRLVAMRNRIPQSCEAADARVAGEIETTGRAIQKPGSFFRLLGSAVIFS